jgi:hypothetical protein
LKWEALTIAREKKFPSKLIFDILGGDFGVRTLRCVWCVYDDIIIEYIVFLFVVADFDMQMLLFVLLFVCFEVFTLCVPKYSAPLGRMR